MKNNEPGSILVIFPNETLPYPGQIPSTNLAKASGNLTIVIMALPGK